MISALSWVRKGYANEEPKKMKHEIDEEIANLQEGDGKMEHSSDSDNEADVAMDEITKKYGLDTYDDEDDIPSFVSAELNLAQKGDKYNIMEEEDEDELEDIKIRKSDSLILGAVAEDSEFSHVSLYVYEEEEKNLFVHHDIILPAFPLAIEWIGHTVSSEPLNPYLRASKNFVAIGTFYPEIEIWDLDVIDVMEPKVTLGGSATPLPTSTSSKKKNMEARIQQMSNDSGKLKEGSHTDAVMSLSWNMNIPNVLASGSADHTAKIWDLNTQQCVYTFVHHKNKVQAVSWHPKEPNLLLTASYDKSAVVVDARTPNLPHRWELGADPEAVQWNPHSPQHFMVSTEDGKITCYDSLMPGKCVYSFQAHGASVSAFSVSPYIPNCIATASTDKSLKIWNISDTSSPSLAFEKSDTGMEIYSMGWNKDLPFLLAFAGKPIDGKENMEVVDVSALPSFTTSFASDVEKLKK